MNKIVVTPPKPIKVNVDKRNNINKKVELSTKVIKAKLFLMKPKKN